MKSLLRTRSISGFSVPCKSDLADFSSILTSSLPYDRSDRRRRFDRFPGFARPGNSCGTWSSTISTIFRRPEVDRNTTSGIATIAILHFGGPVTPEPLESERSYQLETGSYNAPVWRSNLPVVTTSGSDLNEVKVFAPKVVSRSTPEACADMELQILGSMRPGSENVQA
jgi:hypothetical protein